MVVLFKHRIQQQQIKSNQIKSNQIKQNKTNPYLPLACIAGAMELGAKGGAIQTRFNLPYNPLAPYSGVKALGRRGAKPAHHDGVKRSGTCANAICNVISANLTRASIEMVLSSFYELLHPIDILKNCSL